MKIRNLSVLAYANGFTLWHYKAADEPWSATANHGYFNDAADMLASGDMIMISGRGGARIVCVASSRDSSVAVAPLS